MHLLTTMWTYGKTESDPGNSLSGVSALKEPKKLPHWSGCWFGVHAFLEANFYKSLEGVGWKEMIKGGGDFQGAVTFCCPSLFRAYSFPCSGPTCTHWWAPLTFGFQLGSAGNVEEGWRVNLGVNPSRRTPAASLQWVCLLFLAEILTDWWAMTWLIISWPSTALFLQSQSAPGLDTVRRVAWARRTAVPKRNISSVYWNPLQSPTCWVIKFLSDQEAKIQLKTF